MYLGKQGKAATARRHGAGGDAAVRQRTLRTAIGCSGIGLHSGNRITMTLLPAEPGTGIVFRRVDIAGGGATIPALWSRVKDTRMCTVVGSDTGVVVGTVEHLMAAFAGKGVDNVIVEINGPELPVMDGSAAPFVFLMECAGIIDQEAPRQAIRILKTVQVSDGDKMATLYPAESGFSVEFEIAFDNQVISRQSMALEVNGAAFATEISRARTFGFLEEVAHLRANGLARGGSLENAVVISGDSILNEEGLRFDDEFVRHKILDAIGDLYLAGRPLIGHFHGHCSGHALNNRLLHQLFADETAWTLVDVPATPVATPSRWLSRPAIAASA
ncbi:MAG: UDP-3-O-acyl-N-acetylglucosamine deacetylase [Alphaproteobacteria bacterium]